MLLTVFMVALLSAVVIGMLQINTEEIQLMQNHVYAAQAFAAAEAGLNEAFAQLRANSSWAGAANVPFNGGAYTVTVAGSLPTLTLTSLADSAEGFQAKAEADVTVSTTGPYIVRVDQLRINE